MSASGSVPAFSIALTSRGQVKLARDFALNSLRIAYEDRHIIPKQQLIDLLTIYDESVSFRQTSDVELSTSRLEWMHG